MFNVFEGSRRIALFLGAAASLATLASAAFYDPYLNLTYNVESPSSAIVRTNQVCPMDARSHYFSTKTDSSGAVGITLCLLPAKEIKSKSLIFYRLEKDRTVGAAPSYSEEVSKYADELEERFLIPPEDKVLIDKEHSDRYQENWKNTLLYLVAGLIAYWGIVWTIGWIVRGFMGVPRGKDQRPDFK